MLHKHYFMTINDSGSYAGLMIIKSHLSGYKLFSGRLSRKGSSAFVSEHYANEILKNLLMCPAKQSSLWSVTISNSYFIVPKSSLGFVPQIEVIWGDKKQQHAVLLYNLRMEERAGIVKQVSASTLYKWKIFWAVYDVA